jgi:tRNA (adenine37-N6)-methyltransferase
MTQHPEIQQEAERDLKKLKVLLPYWVSHNDQHIQDEEKWLEKIEGLGLAGVASELKQAIEISREANRHIELANQSMQEESAKPEEGRREEKPRRQSREPAPGEETEPLEMNQIGVIRTPYKDSAPYQPLEEDEGDFRIVVDPRYEGGLDRLSDFRYIYVIYFVHQVKREASMAVSPPWTGGMEVGVFASRSPVRPNCIGLSIVQVKGIEGNEIYTSGLDAFDGTPVLDIKPYIKDLDTKDDANYGWIEDMHDYEHLLLHIKGIPHDY